MNLISLWVELWGLRRELISDESYFLRTWSIDLRDQTLFRYICLARGEFKYMKIQDRPV